MNSAQGDAHEGQIVGDCSIHIDFRVQGLNSLKLYRGLYKGALEGLLKGILGV